MSAAFHLQQSEYVGDLDFEAWLNDTAELIQSYNNDDIYSCVQTIGQEDLSQKVVESRRDSTDSVANIEDVQFLCKKDDAKKRRKNHLGREYVCGRPLPLSTRLAILDMHQSGAKACDIAARLNITHGCASKILKRYKTTGTVEAKKIGGSNPKKTVPAVVEAIIKYKAEEPRLRTWELRERLIAEAVCEMHLMPTISSINRIIRLHFGRFYSRRIETTQFQSQNVIKPENRDQYMDEDKSDASGQSLSGSESGEISSQENWQNSSRSALEEFFYFSDESPNCEITFANSDSVFV